MNPDKKDSNSLYKARIPTTLFWFLFLLYAICLLMTIGLIILAINYIVGLIFNTNILGLMLASRCGYQTGGDICVSYKFVFKILNSSYWPVIIIPIMGTLIGSWILKKKK
ncbi:hypothetical protein A2917_00190 [Candidatus Nomurabacteria bacterium RIFCSPLOWO2_01_FULL_42_17]|uniref:Uncharacterized protein n=1 Tax=Candidatus Nomurabacteria bacterium RIFCSPLOWO2_01_FULL_42_17 TaxID=1801780 RepID=A0A1F6XP13_9BACT|nr:MAG: hypothetical protein A2917_00190 [Candidatus Nomurabacteria bacterium RIFCSPLOWO2_01_FULL_42_17]